MSAVSAARVWWNERPEERIARPTSDFERPTLLIVVGIPRGPPEAYLNSGTGFRRCLGAQKTVSLPTTNGKGWGAKPPILSRLFLEGTCRLDPQNWRRRPFGILEGNHSRSGPRLGGKGRLYR